MILLYTRSVVKENGIFYGMDTYFQKIADSAAEGFKPNESLFIRLETGICCGQNSIRLLFVQGAR